MVSGRWMEAAALWLKAGILAKEMGSSVEAITRLDRCLVCLESAAQSHEAQGLKMRCQLTRGLLINDHFGPVERGAPRALAEAADLAEALRDGDAVVQSLTSLAGIRFNSGDFSAATAVARRMIDYGSRHGNERALAIGMASAGMCSFVTGRFEGARVHLEEALAGLSRCSGGVESYEGHTLTYLAFTRLILGDAAAANDLCALAIEQARRRRTSELAAALGNSLYLRSIQGDVEQVRRTCEELQKVAEEKGFLMWLHQAKFFQGWANAASGERSGLEMMEAAMDRFREAHELVEQSFFYGLLAESYLALDLPERARENVERGLELVAALGETFFEAPLLRLKARCLHRAGETTSAPEIAELFARAQQLAIQQGAIAWHAPA